MTVFFHLFLKTITGGSATPKKINPKPGIPVTVIFKGKRETVGIAHWHRRNVFACIDLLTDKRSEYYVERISGIGR